MINVKLFTSLMLIIMLGACSNGIKTRNDYRPEVDFTTLKTYQYLSFSEEPKTQDIYSDRVKTALNNTLKAKGLTQKEADADLLIAYHIFTDTKEQERITTTGGGIYYGRSYMGPTLNMGTTYVDKVEYRVGNLVVDFIEPESRKVLWHGEAEANVDDARTPEERTAMIQAAVDQLLESFPPKQQ
jgi:hypothetical protein